MMNDGDDGKPADKRPADDWQLQRAWAGTQLGRSSDRLGLALEAAGLGTFRVDVENYVVHYSPELAGLLGVANRTTVSVDEALARVHREHAAAVRKQFNDVLDPRGSGRLRMEFRFVKPGGEIRWLAWLGQAEFSGEEGAGRKPVSILGVCADITERKTVEEKLRQSETRFRALVELSSDWYWEQDEDLRFTEISPPAALFTGFNPKKYIGRKRWDNGPYDLASPHWRQHFELLAQHKPFRDFEYSIRVKDGRILWLSVNGDPIFDADGRFKGYRGTGHGLTARKEAERRIRESELRFQILADSAPVLIWVAGEAGAVYFNRPYLKFVGVDDEAELIGDKWISYLHPEDRGIELMEFCSFMQNHNMPEKFEAQVRLRRFDGVYHWMKVICLSRSDLSGNADGYVGSMLDVSDLKEHEERIALLMRELDHRVKNTLARVDAIVTSTLEGGEEVDCYRNAVQSRIQSMARAHDLLSLTTISGAELRHVIETQIEAFASSGNFVIDGPPVFVKRDAAQALSMVINELTTNAVKYGALSASNGRVHVSWRIETGTGRQHVVRIEWREENGPRVIEPAKAGIGVSVIRELPAHQMDAEVKLTFPPEGVRCELKILLSELMEDPAEAPAQGLAGP
ncbi:MAG: PAS domain S-box protein [Hyphomicrobiaceae bacterium]